MKHRKQILSLLLAFVFVLSLLPGLAFAENAAADLPEEPADLAAPANTAAEDTPGQAEDEFVLPEGEDGGELIEETADTGYEEPVQDENADDAPLPAAVSVLFLADDMSALSGLTVTREDGGTVDPLFDADTGTIAYGSYLLVPGVYCYAFHDDSGLFEDMEAQSFLVDGTSAEMQIDLVLREVPAGPSPVTVSFVCAQGADLSGLQLSDVDGMAVSPASDTETGAAVLGSYLLLPGEYRYTFHDESGQFKDLSDSLYVDGARDLQVDLDLQPAAQGLCFSGGFVNPIYENVISESDLPAVAISPEESLARLQEAVSPEIRPNGNQNRRFLSSDPIPIYDSFEDAGSAVRKALINRSDTISLRLLTDLEPSKEAWDTICYMVYLEAIRHNGTATEGDYLRYEYGGVSYTGSIVSAEIEGLSYYEVVYAPLYFTSRDQEQELNARVSAILASLDLGSCGDYEKIKAIYDYVCSHVSYDYKNLYDDSYTLKYTAYAALVNGAAVCQGYSVAIYRMCLSAGLDARVVTSADILHAWNIVLIDGARYYYLDATWDADSTSGDYQFFLKGITSWVSDHPLGDEFGPVASLNGFDGYQVSETDYERPAAVIRKASVVFEGMIRIKYYFKLNCKVKFQLAELPAGN